MASPKAILRRANKLKSTQGRKITWLRVILASDDLDAEAQINQLQNDELTGRGICLHINKTKLTQNALADSDLADMNDYTSVLGLKV
tara:strand:+ start:3584 stop:3844 length:261 start_codon:yes stop_codon:yes gene_type:complete